MHLDFVNRTFLLCLNHTLIVNTTLLNEFSVSADLDRVVFTYDLLFSFYFNVQFYTGGFDMSRVTEILRTLDNNQNIQKYTRDTFKPLFNRFVQLDARLFFSACIRHIRINSFEVAFDDLNNVVEYKNVRFDGCPRQREAYAIAQRETLESIKIVYSGNASEAFDAGFNSFTEYFYRVVASNSQGF